MNKITKRSLYFTYGLATIGDLTYSLVVTASILYAVQLGGNPAQTGLIAGGYGMTYLISPSIFGKLSDKISRRTSLIIATVLQFATAMYLLLFVDSIVLLFICQMLFGFIYGFFWTSIEAHISENTHNSEREHQNGISNFCVSWSIGFMLGPLLGGIFSDLDVNFSFITNVILYSSAFFLVLIGIPKTEENNAKNNKEDLKNKNFLNDNSNINEQNKKTIPIIIIIFTMFLYAMMSRLVLSYFTDYAVRPDSLDWSGTLIGQTIFMFGIGRTIYFLSARYWKINFFKSSLKKNKNCIFSLWNYACFNCIN
jgi:MFS family permease